MTRAIVLLRTTLHLHIADLVALDRAEKFEVIDAIPVPQLVEGNAHCSWTKI